ncbi:phospholipase B1, membrane-associated [Rhincodon typus]|uniref:phospholipase B1, membrane-associated n=1 Tax=Rhincodon typus TaxID=259920 RepID=UPI002030F20C|nr:phospholipase B1, membrane-associated [Rhincodon typus]
MQIQTMKCQTASVLILTLSLQLIQGLAEDLAEGKHLSNKENSTNPLADGESFKGRWVGCSEEIFSNSPSDSVHALRPSQIKVVARLGDALTVEPPQHSGHLTSNDKDPDSWMPVSLPDILKSFNPGVIGYSLGNGNHVNTSLDLSVVRAKAGELPGMAQKLVTSLKNNMLIDFQKDWKLITVYLGIGDMCAYCTNQEYYSPEKVVLRIKEALDILHREIPRAYVNLVEMPDINLLHQLSDRATGLRGWCECLVKPHESFDISAQFINWDYQNTLQELVYSGIYDKHNNFTVVLQPFIKNMEIPLTADGQPNLSCFTQNGFHFNAKGHALLDSSLWNNMIKPSVGGIEVLECTATVPQLHCPSQERPYLFTYQNRDYGNSQNMEDRGPSQQSSGSKLTCTERDPSDAIPVSVHKLRPADIKVIAALGDSITAGNGAGSKPSDLLDVLTQYRGFSWSIGGDENITAVTTLTNILREFNPSLVGYSTGIGREDTPQAFLNQAVAGAESMELMSQIRSLVKLLRNDSRINFQEDWKIITLFIGGNDLCACCKDPSKYSPENFTNSIRNALDMLHNEVPRAFVNLVTVLNILPLRGLFTNTRVNCPRFLLKLLCNCVINPQDNSIQLEKLRILNRKYQERTHMLVESGRYDTREDFTVVIQPFLENIEIPRDKNGLPDKTYFSPDCFHFSLKGHSQAARGLWNNLLEPLGKKNVNQTFDGHINISCPSKEQPYLRTYRNSNFTYPNNPGQLTTVTPETIKTTTVPSFEVFGSQLLCKDRAPSDIIPNSVHSLRPADVKVIGAVGDSLTAGNGIGSKPNDVLDVLTQYRGLSFSIGGDESLRSSTTLPNILREFNPSLTGFSTGKGNLENPKTFLNQAFPGALAADLPGQVRRLVDIMKNHPKIDFQNDWKIINMFIGGNDICNYCTDLAYYSAVNFARRIEEALDILHKEVPRTFVNLIEVLELIPLRRLHQDTQLNCPRTLVRMLCYCVVKPNENSPELQMMIEANKAYQAGAQCISFSCGGVRRRAKTLLVNSEPGLRQPTSNIGGGVGLMQNDRIHLEGGGRGSNGSGGISEGAHCQDPEGGNNVGFGAKAKTILELRIQYQGVAWSIGGDKSLKIVTTLPNVLKKFNPRIYGFATGIGKWNSKFNVAVPGAMSHNVPKQARTLVQLMKNSSKINFKQDWKVITLFIGANDLCEYCMNKEAYSADNYVKHIEEALDILHQQVPRAFINMVQILEMSGIRRLKKNTIGCALLQKDICPCFLNPRENSPELHEMIRVNRDYQSKLTALIYSGKYDTNEEFTVVLQPYFTNAIVPLNSTGQPDMSFFSVDCFHLSERGQAEMAIGLWNNMLERTGYKQNYINFTYDRTKLKCPNSDAPYLFTHRNSAVKPENPSIKPTSIAVTTTAKGGLTAEQRVWLVVLTAVVAVILGQHRSWSF